MLKIKNLSVTVNNELILKNINLSIKKHEIHVILGSNGSGKSTLASTIAGNPAFRITKGYITYNFKNINHLPAEIRSKEGIFVSFQNPAEISGITNYEFLQTIYNKKFNKKPLEFFKELSDKLQLLKYSNKFLFRDLNYGFSGGEKKKNEFLQLLLLEPKLAILDEIDSGLDFESINLIFQIISNSVKKTSFLIITHSFYFLKYFKPTYVYLMKNGLLEKIKNFK